MRPQGEIRQQLLAAAPVQTPEGHGLSWLSLAAVAKVGLEQARRTVDNAARAGELVVVGEELQPLGRPRKLYARPAATDAAPAPGAELAQAWASFC